MDVDSSFIIDLDLTEFPKLEYVVRGGGVMLVDRNGSIPQFVPVVYYLKRNSSIPLWNRYISNIHY